MTLGFFVLTPVRSRQVLAHAVTNQSLMHRRRGSSSPTGLHLPALPDSCNLPELQFMEIGEIPLAPEAAAVGLDIR